MSSAIKIKTALISTSDKSLLLPFAEALAALNIKILATGGTAEYLSSNGVPITEISDYTHLPEMMGGRVKTLHHKIHAGILARRGIDDDLLKEQDFLSIDLVVVNLYPFEQTIQNPQCTAEEAIENIDIGGPTLLRGAAKNHEAVTAVVDPQDYEAILTELKQSGGTLSATRRSLAQKVFSYLSHYDGTIAHYLNQLTQENKPTFPTVYQSYFRKKITLRYGENPHQKAAWYQDQSNTGLAHAEQLQGKELSFNNLLDSDAALNCVQELNKDLAACVIVKHGSPCGVAVATEQLDAYQNAYATDPSSAFGGIIAFNTALNYLTAEVILAQQFVEVILAPAFDDDVIHLLRNKPNVRALCYKPNRDAHALSHYSISGGLLLQERDLLIENPNEWKMVTQRKPTESELKDLYFAWTVVKWTKSNAIIYAKNQSTLGIGTGQCSRVFSAEIAVLKAHHADLDLKNSVMASDAFFPFADSIDVAVNAGITAIVQPGGSKNDAEVIEAANKAGVSMVLTGVRHFRH